jgi:ppGpp synthetase/RelA/SpoT-type nucleotidyltranferase
MSLLDDFDRCHATFRDFASKMDTLLRELLESADLRVHSIATRAKSRDSFASKISKIPGRYSEFHQITDICGARVITYFEDQVEAIAQIIEQEFDIDRENSIDKRQTFDPDRFGYVSVHYVASLSQSRTSLAEYRRFRGLKFEIQIRSILQHAWAEIEHDLQYKTKEAVPRQIRRRFARLSGLLELADAEFIGLRTEIESYQKILPSEIEQSPATVLIDRDSLTAWIGQSGVVVDIDEQIAARLKTQRSEEVLPLDSVLLALDRLRITDIGSLEAELEANSPMLPAFAEALVSEMFREYEEQTQRAPRSMLVQRGAAVSQLVLYLMAARIPFSDLAEALKASGFRHPNLAEKLRAVTERLKS